MADADASADAGAGADMDANGEGAATPDSRGGLSPVAAAPESPLESEAAALLSHALAELERLSTVADTQRARLRRLEDAAARAGGAEAEAELRPARERLRLRAVARLRDPARMQAVARSLDAHLAPIFGRADDDDNGGGSGDHDVGDKKEARDADDGNEDGGAGVEEVEDEESEASAAAARLAAHAERRRIGLSGLLSQRADAALAERVARYAPLRRCIEQAYEGWGRLVLALLCLVTRLPMPGRCGDLPSPLPRGRGRQPTQAQATAAVGGPLGLSPLLHNAARRSSW